MAVSCPEVMYGAYYPYLYGRAGPSRPFYQYERVSFCGRADKGKFYDDAREVDGKKGN